MAGLSQARAFFRMFWIFFHVQGFAVACVLRCDIRHKAQYVLGILQADCTAHT
jgi:hypothetical protein